MNSMDTLIFISYEAATSLIPVLAILIILYLKDHRKTDHLHFSSYVLMLEFAVYLIGVYHFTGSGTLYDSLRYGLLIRNVNLIPFSNYIFVPAYLLNILLFMPFGILVPLCFKKLDSFPFIFFSGAAFSTFIELTQLLNTRATDVDDLIMNTLGAVSGYVLIKLIMKMLSPKERKDDVAPVMFVLIMVSAFAGRFLFLYRGQVL